MSAPDFRRTYVLPAGMNNEAFYKEQAEYWREIAEQERAQLASARKALAPFDRAMLTPDGYVVGLTREDFSAVREFITQTDDQREVSK